ncbi:hypothetical protein RI367_000559 [Sorochytrium milnesiophthora]
MSSFLHRFYVRQLLRLSARPPSVSPLGLCVRPEELVGRLTQLLGALYAVDKQHAAHLPPRRWHQLQTAVKPAWTFSAAVSVEPQASFLTQGQASLSAPRDQGTVYSSTDPILIQSLRNQYMLRRNDGSYIDGKPRGLSARIYRSLYRQHWFPGALFPPCDTTWLAGHDNALRNPIAIGQYINNATAQYAANVTYHELDMPLQMLPRHLHQYLPNTLYSPPIGYPMLAGPSYSDVTAAVTASDTDTPGVVLPMIALVTTVPVRDGEELRSTYFTLEAASSTRG